MVQFLYNSLSKIVVLIGTNLLLNFQNYANLA